MASEQQQRRENTTLEREVYIQKDKVPKMTTHFEALTVHTADTSAGRKDTSLDSSSKQSSQHDDKVASMRSGNTVGDVEMGKARETYEIGSHKLESFRDTCQQGMRTMRIAS
ncbi:seed biotin-containing protein SBP65-like [Pyrus ussuriensis x Pyrus communis]|uniref:Seed biotin-containing protein SBP65-like n=1 Tax=Pyrus ussuriensis x Pyrus communis TaxID=2448454 RepID=A0A5N5GAY8_9ROSA|nr:seed biotin-containing protein SBP65-like [Pyrus ussuriensis x Pyrus communis]